MSPPLIDAHEIWKSYRTSHDGRDKMRRDAMESAESRRRQGISGGLFAGVRRGSFSFFRTYVFQAGFRDGRRGLVAAIARSQETFWRYLATGWEKSS